VPARDQRQVYTRYVNEQGHGDTEEAHPKPPVAVGAFPIGTMNMRFMMVIVLDVIHSYPVFLGSLRAADNRLEIQEFQGLNYYRTRETHPDKTRLITTLFDPQTESPIKKASVLTRRQAR
jgi:hypothetical protein